MASAEVREVNAVIGINGYASWPRPFRKGIFLDLHRLRIDARHLICRKLAKHGNALVVDGDPVGMRILRWRTLQIDFPAAWIQSAHHIGHLKREPQHALAIKHGRVWILALWIGDLVFRYGSRPGVELADVTLEISREPDISVAIGNQSMWSGVFHLQRVLFERAALRIQPPDLAHHLFRKPQRPVSADRRIMRMRAFRGHIPFPDRHFELADFGRGPRSAQRVSNSKAENCAAQNNLSSSSHLDLLDRIPSRGALGSIAFSPLWFLSRKLCPIFVCQFKGSLHWPNGLYDYDDVEVFDLTYAFGRANVAWLT